MKWFRRILKVVAAISLLAFIALFAMLYFVDFQTPKSEIADKMKGFRAESHTYTFGRKTVHYVETGSPDKPLLIFVHGA
ncbi:MAG: hypothetical protein AAF740_14115, partial [Bacteroidota bacterium]